MSIVWRDLSRFIPYPFGVLFLRYNRSKRVILFHRILAIFLYGQMIFYWSDLSKVIQLASPLFSIIQCAIIIMNTWFFWFLGTLPGKNNKIVILSAFGYSFGTMMYSFCFNFIFVFATSDDKWVESIVYGGFATFLFSFIACLHAISLSKKCFGQSHE